MILTIINGPNLNLLGTREKEVYGNKSFGDYLEGLRSVYPDIEFRYYQSNIEGELIDIIQEAATGSDGVILNAAGFTHTSVAIADAVAAISIPIVEVHISNILGREEYRHLSLIAPHCSGSLFGFGLDGYRLATEALFHIINNRK
ncbi:MAG: type II 3-dehydroquinate dehydratase [Bacteroidales bacterium]|nr:type II 3-dehydroquinate dehydratase [Bacteroidales bacterium]